MRPHHGVRRALLATVAVATALAAASCSGTDASAGDHPASGSPTASRTGTPTPSGASSSAEPTAQVDHTVPAPGPRAPGLVAPADILVTGPHTLSQATVDAIRKMSHVSDVEVISLATPLIEDQAFTVAAVDPGQYRSFTQADAANTDAIWDRVADGELALKSQRKGNVPLDAQGYLKLGSAANAPTVHVGAYTPQSPLIDAVVNDTWIKTLGMTPDNALLIRTGTHTPQQLRKPLQKLLGKDVSVQLTDTATRKHLDPNALQVAVVTGSVSDAVGVYRYTVLGGGHIAPDPAWVAAHITTEVVPILGAVTCNRLIFPQLKAALQAVVDQGLAGEIHPDEYAGCYYPRFIAGTTTLSNHAFGLALDINAIENQRGTAGHQDPAVVAIFEKWGFTWGGTWSYTDPMHFEMNQIVSPQGLSARTTQKKK